MNSLRVRELSPRGAGGVSVLEFAGPGAREALERLCGGARLRSGVLRVVRVSAPLDAGRGEALDEALAWCESDERAELHLHGSAPLVRQVLALCAALPPDPPATLEQRAEQCLAAAPCEHAARILLDQCEGALARELADWDALSDAQLAARASALAERSRIARFALEPARVVLAGPVNAGKSSLFNLLHGRERVVVSAQAGTTRDAIAERAQLGAWPIELVDTAGERGAGGGELERAGQSLARELRRAADLVLWLSPADAPCAPPAAGEARTVVLTSRSDLAPAAPGAPHFSVLRDPAAALATVATAFRASLGLPERAWEPGAAVAFDRELCAALARLRHALAAGERPRAADELARLRGPAR